LILRGNLTQAIRTNSSKGSSEGLPSKCTEALGSGRIERRAATCVHGRKRLRLVAA
jgi:hypothetical protein